MLDRINLKQGLIIGLISGLGILVPAMADEDGPKPADQPRKVEKVEKHEGDNRPKLAKPEKREKDKDDQPRKEIRKPDRERPDGDRPDAPAIRHRLHELFGRIQELRENGADREIEQVKREIIGLERELKREAAGDRPPAPRDDHREDRPEPRREARPMDREGGPDQRRKEVHIRIEEHLDGPGDARPHRPDNRPDNRPEFRPFDEMRPPQNRPLHPDHPGELRPPNHPDRREPGPQGGPLPGGPDRPMPIHPQGPGARGPMDRGPGPDGPRPFVRPLPPGQDHGDRGPREDVIIRREPNRPAPPPRPEIREGEKLRHDERGGPPVRPMAEKPRKEQGGEKRPPEAIERRLDELSRQMENLARQMEELRRELKEQRR